jgi:ABC-type sugar transport system ATPase subunit
MSVKENISLSSLDDIAKGPFVRKRRELEITRRYIEQLHIRPPAAEAGVEELSGGNRQKVVLARWLNTKARVLIFDEPTAGIDVGARYEIYTMLNELVQKGIGVIIISSELPELLGMCDRVVVMCEGSIAGVLDRNEATQEKILTMATGGT